MSVPPGFALRHQQIMQDLLAAARMSGIDQGTAVGRIGAALHALATEADPNVSLAQP
jgi:hypothetical protein